ncbi:MAG TPA: hypothetical protein VHH36_02420 [Candidatus Thermoplasmatota archaeon]|nr:hypothetical protein [Candidatus Thermoplasmatota archaeon]
MSAKKEEHPVQLTLGSRYHVRSLASREAVLDTMGAFRGVVSVGTIDGIAMELDGTHKDLKGKIRVIPTHMVLSIDILEAVKKEEEAKDEAAMHYT